MTDNKLGEREDWIAAHGWKWVTITPKNPEPKTFRYRGVKMMRPTITVYYD